MSRAARRLVAVACLSMTGCAVARVGLDQTCELNSDCQDLLVCAGGVCRAECISPRDCPPGRSCVPSGTPDRPVCSPPDAPALCVFHSECPLGTYCLFGRCHAQCAEDRDCPDAGRCDAETGTCEAAVHVDQEGRFTPPPPGGELPPCGNGRARCDGVCVDLGSSPSHCGACGQACGDNEDCLNAACVCAPPRQLCGDACVDPERDPAHCGGCFAPCDGPCSEGRCCGPGRASCGGACVDVSEDVERCGACDVRCGDREVCFRGTCAQEHQDCDDARTLVLTPGTTTVERSRTDGGGLFDFNGCAPISWPDVFYRFTLPERSMLLVRTVVAMGRELRVGFLTGGCDELGTACGTAPCPDATPDGERHGSAVYVLAAGEHRMVVESDEGTGFRLHVDVLPIGDAAVSTLPEGAFTLDGTIAAGSGRADTCAPGDERVFAFVTCEDFPGGRLSASVTGGVVGVSGGAVPLVCGGASVARDLAPGSGLYGLVVEGADPSLSTTFRVTGSRP